MGAVGMGRAGPCAGIVLLLLPRREGDSAAAGESTAVPWLCPVGWVVWNLRSRCLGKLFLGEKPSLRENWSSADVELSKDSDKPGVWLGQQRRAEGAELPLLCNFLISSKKSWCGCGICINV